MSKSVEFKNIESKYGNDPINGGIYLIIEEDRNGLIDDYFFAIIGKEVINNGELSLFGYSQYLKFYPIMEDIEINTVCDKDYLKENIIENSFLGNRIDYILTSEIRNSLFICQRKGYGSLLKLMLNSKIDQIRNRSLSFIYLKAGLFEAIEFQVSELDSDITILDIAAKEAVDNTFSSLSLEETKNMISQYFCIKNFGVIPPEGYGCSSTRTCDKCKECWNLPINHIKFGQKDISLHYQLFTAPIEEPVNHNS